MAAIVMPGSVGPVTLSLPQGVDFVFRSLVGHEELGVPFRFNLELLSPVPSVPVAKLLGQPLSVHLQIDETNVRHFNGVVTEFALAGTSGSLFLYKVTLRPALWFLMKTTNCRIFQRQTAPDIARQMLRERGFPFEDLIGEKYPTLEFVVQYRETDFNFLTRMLEHAGIHFFFKHEADRHVMVLADAAAVHGTVKGFETVPFFPPDRQRQSQIDVIDGWQLSHAVTTGNVALNIFDFMRPRADLSALAQATEPEAQAPLVIYDFPGEYREKSDGNALARRSSEALQVGGEVVSAEGNARGLSVGHLFTLSEHTVNEHNREYLITSANFQITTHDPESTITVAQDEVFHIDFSAIPSSRQFRPARRASKPVCSTQTAIVVGKEGEEIWTDPEGYGRVKVRFHWDFASSGDEESSCWVRVSQSWAGSNFGTLHIPRIGQEVIVDFLEGDPDQPIITGRVYNFENRPPFDLPKNQTQSGIKTRSTKGGAQKNCNEIRFEDKKGEEELYIQAEKTQTTVVKGSQTISVGGERTTTVTKKDTQNYKDAREISVDKTDILTITEKHSGYYNNEREAFVGTRDYNYVDGTKKTEVKGDIVITATAEYLVIQGDNMIDLLGSIAKFANLDSSLFLDGGKGSLSASEQLVLKSGDTSITITAGGDITIKGKKITVDADEVMIKGSSSIGAESASVDIKGTSGVKINS